MSLVRSGKNAAPAHILLVDDNSLGLSVRRSVLEEVGYVVTSCSSGQDGLEQFAAQKFDLIVTDFKMPVMSGIEFIQLIRSQQPDAAIILISGFVDALGLDEKTTGADAVIQKSSHEVPNLLRAASRLLQRKAPRKPASSQARARTKRASR